MNWEFGGNEYHYATASASNVQKGPKMLYHPEYKKVYDKTVYINNFIQKTGVITGAIDILMPKGEKLPGLSFPM